MCYFSSVVLAIHGTDFEDLTPVFYRITYFRVYKATEWVNSDDWRVRSMTGKQIVSEIIVLVKLALENIKRKKKAMKIEISLHNWILHFCEFKDTNDLWLNLMRCWILIFSLRKSFITDTEKNIWDLNLGREVILHLGGWFWDSCWFHACICLSQNWEFSHLVKLYLVLVTC